MQSKEFSKPDSDAHEDKLLSGILRWSDPLDDVAAIIRPDMFRQDSAQKMFAVMLDLHGQRPITPDTVAAAMADRGDLENVGGSDWIYRIWDMGLSGGHAVHHASHVRDAFLRRSLAHLSVEMEIEASRPTMTAVEAVEATERKLWDLSELGASGQVCDLVPSYNAILDSLDGQGNKIDGLPTGLRDLDNLIYGLQETHLVVVGARPSTGKTALGLTIARNLALAGKPVFFASMEQPRMELAERLIAGQANVDGQRIRRSILNPEEKQRVADAVHVLRYAPFQADDNGAQTVQRIASNARRLKRLKGIRAVIIDYLQLVHTDDRRLKRYEQIGIITRRLKLLARELSIPVVALAQLNRGAEDHQEPKLSDLRESGDIEQDADTVLLLNKPATREDKSPNDGDIVAVDVIIAKHRNGPCGRVVLSFNKPYVSFGNMASDRDLWPNFR